MSGSLANPAAPTANTTSAAGAGEIARFMSQAVQLLREGNLPRAEALCRIILAVTPRHADALHLLGVIALQQKQFADADRWIAKSLEIQPNSADAWNNRGTALCGISQCDDALKNYDKALALRPKFPEALRNRGNAFRDLGRLEEALVDYDAALTLRPQHADALSDHAKILRRLGRLDEALASCDRALSIRPDDTDVLDTRGNLLRDLGRSEEALATFDRLLALEPANSAALFHHANILRGLGRLDAALASLDRLLALCPDDAERAVMRAVLLIELRRFDEAVAGCEQALAIRPDYAQALNNRGDALKELGRIEEALDSYNQALALEPNSAGYLNNKGKALGALGRLAEAVAAYEAALQAKPDYADARNGLDAAQQDFRYFQNLTACEPNLEINPNDAEALHKRADALLGLRRFDEALTAYDRSLLIRPDNPEALANRAVALGHLGRLDEAVLSCDKALAIKPEAADLLNNRGNFLQGLGRLEEAAASYAAAFAVEPDQVEALNNRGTVLGGLGQFEAALACYASALAIRPDFAAAEWHEALCRLSHGDYETGWKKYEARWRLNPKESRRTFTKPLWLGKEDIAGKTVLLYSEQGFGDTLQFCRYAPMVAAKGATVILGNVPAPLKALLRSLAGFERVAIRDDVPSDDAFDFHCPLMSLPLAFGTRLDTIPAQIPYLSADYDRVEKWRKRLAKLEGIKVGLVWAGNPKFAADQERSLSFDRLESLAAMPGVTLVSLQKGEPASQIRTVLHSCVVHDWTSELVDFSDTAALVSALDLVISVDSAVGHLAGALGKPVWLLNRHDRCYRWLRERDDSPWYPTMRLFTQPTRGDWVSVVDRVRAELRQLAQNKPASSPAPVSALPSLPLVHSSSHPPLHHQYAA